MRRPHDDDYCSRCDRELRSDGTCHDCDPYPDGTAPGGDLGGCLPVTPPLSLLAGLPRRRPD
ncbi:MAG: hypothetical protein OXI64_06000 [Defluviicoccus sp.]|nr:hypothetical protein [Defluviicoccus sp.]